MTNKAAVTSPDILAAIKRWPTARAEIWTRRFVEEAHRNENVVAVLAIGSAVRANVRSVDLDLVVICKDPRQLQLQPPLEIDLRIYAASSVDEEIGKGNDLLGWAIKFGYPVFQRNAYWDSVVTRWHNKVPLPSLEVAIRRAVDALHRMTKVLDLGDTHAAKEQAVSYVTHLARAELIRHTVYPASRPELSKQLREIGSAEIAQLLEEIIDAPGDRLHTIRQLAKDRSLIDQVKHRPQ